MREQNLSTASRSSRAGSREDQETHARLLNAAARLFADRGFAKVTVRDICQKARANVAAVNYHFGGKDGLYRAVIETAIATMQKTTDEARAAGDGRTAEVKLREYIRVFVTRVAGHGGDTWIHHLMMREISDPTTALDLVAERVLRPRMAYLCGIIGELVGAPPDDERVVRNALSVQSQFHALTWSRMMAKVVPGFETSPEALDAIASHITCFSLGGIARTRGGL
jgi:TetR/AcrR family transcriptional regulator, regulator of cefoperazone and chloramphenicol sensitivity